MENNASQGVPPPATWWEVGPGLTSVWGITLPTLSAFCSMVSSGKFMKVTGLFSVVP